MVMVVTGVAVAWAVRRVSKLNRSEQIHGSLSRLGDVSIESNLDLSQDS